MNQLHNSSVAELKVREEITTSVVKANLYSLVFFVPIFLLFVLPYLLLWGDGLVDEVRAALAGDASTGFLLKMLRLGKYLGLFYLVMILGVVAHELIHGITWAIYAKNGWESIKFGVMWQMLTPYAHCKEPLKVKPYRLGAAMPGIILGIIPSIIGLINGNGVIFSFGVFFTFAASGDFLMLWLTRHLRSTDLVQDHPDKIGCMVLEG